MDFKIENIGNNVKITLNSSTATCFFLNTPILDGKNIGCIGELEINNYDDGIKLIKKCEDILREKEVKYIVAPMNGNTWKKYRTLKYSNGDEPFILENVNPIEDNEVLKNTGFNEINTYTSCRGLISDAYKSELIDIAENQIKTENITIRKFNKENYIEDLNKIFNVSKESFTRNPFYTPIERGDFISQYEPYISMIDEDLILIAEKNGIEVGFVFCIPDFNELKRGKPLQTLILKTIAVKPEFEDLAIGNVLLNRIANIAKEKNYLEWIFAFMYSNNTSQKMASRNGAKVIREYALYGKEL
jgi:ribosomal protein S18 acetylase RimI-like enzyme